MSKLFDAYRNMNTVELAEKSTLTLATIDSKIAARNALFDAETIDTCKLNEVDDEISNLVKDYNTLCEYRAIFECLGESAMVKAARLLYYPTIKVSDDKENKGKVMRSESRKIMNISHLRSENQGKVGADVSWESLSKNLLYLVTAQVSVSVSDGKVGDYVDIFKTPFMLNVRKEMEDTGKSPSKTYVSKYLARVIEAMLGDGYEVKSFDVSFLDNAVTRWNERDAMSLEVMKLPTFQKQLLTVCHRVIAAKEGNEEESHYKTLGKALTKAMGE